MIAVERGEKKLLTEEKWLLYVQNIKAKYILR